MIQGRTEPVATDPGLVDPIVERIKSRLGGHPRTQGAVLADLVAIFLAGHSVEAREEQWLIPVNEAKIPRAAAPAN